MIVTGYPIWMSQQNKADVDNSSSETYVVILSGYTFEVTPENHTRGTKPSVVVRKTNGDTVSIKYAVDLDGTVTFITNPPMDGLIAYIR
jgi:hypothetical protein